MSKQEDPLDKVKDKQYQIYSMAKALQDKDAGSGTRETDARGVLSSKGYSQREKGSMDRASASPMFRDHSGLSGLSPSTSDGRPMFSRENALFSNNISNRSVNDRAALQKRGTSPTKERGKLSQEYTSGASRKANKKTDGPLIAPNY